MEAQKKTQLKRLQDEAHALHGMVNARPGVISPREWEKVLQQAGDYIGNGRFLVRCLGAERYLDAETVAVLITLRQNLIADLPRPSAADIMMIDAAVVAYYTSCGSRAGSAIWRWSLKVRHLGMRRSMKSTDKRAPSKNGETKRRAIR